MKLSELQPGSIVLSSTNYTAYLSTTPFYSLSINPIRNPFGLFSFVVHQSDGNNTYRCLMFKTSYYTSPVIQERFDDVEVDNVVKWINDTLIKIKEGL